jgi:hypothetical protein
MQSFEGLFGSAMQPPKKAKTSAKQYQSYVPTAEEKESMGKFFINVKNDWRSVRGFQLFEYLEETRTINGDVMHVPSCREWYCAKELEPAGGFRKGHMGFLPKSKSWSVPPPLSVSPLIKDT